MFISPEEDFNMMAYYEYLYEESHKEDQIKEKTFEEVRA